MNQHIHNNNELYLNLGGSGVQVSGNRRIPMSKGDLFLFPAGQPHAASADEGGFSDAAVVNFDSAIFGSNVMGDSEISHTLSAFSKNAREGKNRIRLEKASTKSATSLLRDMVNLCRHKEPGFRSKIKARMLDLFLVIIRDKNHRDMMHQIFSRPSVSDRLESVFRLVECNYMNKLTVDMAAELAYLSRSHFHSVFREATGVTFVDYLHGIRVKNARQLLIETDMPITHISLACGFQSLSHFYRTFSTLTGKSPNTYRRMAKS